MTNPTSNTLPKSPIVLIQNPKSGHCHKVSLFMALNAIPFTTVEPDMAKGEHKSDRFSSLNVFKQVPVITDGDITLADSNAILVYLIRIRRRLLARKGRQRKSANSTLAISLSG